MHTYTHAQSHQVSTLTTKLPAHTLPHIHTQAYPGFPPHVCARGPARMSTHSCLGPPCLCMPSVPHSGCVSAKMGQTDPQVLPQSQSPPPHTCPEPACLQALTLHSYPHGHSREVWGAWRCWGQGPHCQLCERPLAAGVQVLKQAPRQPRLSLFSFASWHLLRENLRTASAGHGASGTPAARGAGVHLRSSPPALAAPSEPVPPPSLCSGHSCLLFCAASSACLSLAVFKAFLKMEFPVLPPGRGLEGTGEPRVAEDHLEVKGKCMASWGLCCLPCQGHFCFIPNTSPLGELSGIP